MEQNNDVAVIGMAGVFPLSDDLNEYWGNLISAKNLISDFSKNNTNNSNNKKVFSFGAIRNPFDFDPYAFKISKKEAALLSPQERLLMQTIFRALEDGGILNPEKSRTGLILGAGPEEYNKIDESSKTAAFLEDFRGDGDSKSLANRMSYYFNFTGPSVYLDTSCSTSLSCVHYGARTLQCFDADVMVCAGVNLFFNQKNYTPVGNVMSESGVVRAFDKDGDGFVPGNGCGIVILKRLSDAEKDKNHIYAVIKGSYLNNDGKRKAGFSAPSVEGEKETVSNAIKNAGLTPDDICYVEAHGTATTLGDAVELRALNRVFGSSRQEKLYIGSVKSSIGHLNAAAGIASFIKGVMILDKGKIPESINIKNLNEEIENTKLEPAAKTVSLYKEGEFQSKKIKNIGISSVGAGGNNVHVVLQNYFKDYEVKDSTKAVIFLPVCAASQNSLSKNKEEMLKNFFNSDEKMNFSYSLSLAKHNFQFKDYFIFDSASKKIIPGIFHRIPENLKIESKAVIGNLGTEKENYLKVFEFLTILYKGFKQNLTITGNSCSLIFETALKKDYSKAQFTSEIEDFILKGNLEQNKIELEQNSSKADFYNLMCFGKSDEIQKLEQEPFVKLNFIDVKDIFSFYHTIGYIYTCSLDFDFSVLYDADTRFVPTYAYQFEKEYFYKNHFMPDLDPIKKEEIKLDEEDKTGRFSDVKNLPETMEALCCCAASDFIKNCNYKNVSSFNQLKKELKVIDYYEGFLFYLVQLLEKKGVIQRNKTTNELKISEEIEKLPALIQAKEEAIRNYPAYKSFLTLFYNCSVEYKNVFSGLKPGNELLYPNGDFDMLYKVGAETPVFEGDTTYVKLFGKAVKILCQQKAGKLRILEAGSGTGKISWELLENLKDLDVEYYFTDIGKSFVAKAKAYAKEKGYKNVVFKVYNIEDECSKSGIPEESFDFVISYNVIQATSSVNKVLKNLNKALKPDGFLLMVQTFDLPCISNLIYGFAPGWWNYYQDDLRKESGIFPSIKMWEEELTKTDFHNINFITGGYNGLRKDIGLVLAQKNWDFDWKENTALLTEEKEAVKNQKIEKEDTVQNFILSLLQETMDFEEEDLNQNLFDLGMDSLSVLILKAKISEKYELELSVEELYKCDTIKNLIEMITEKNLNHSQKTEKIESVKINEKGSENLLSLIDEI